MVFAFLILFAELLGKPTSRDYFFKTTFLFYTYLTISKNLSIKIN
jgi:hypothetical protein